MFNILWILVLAILTGFGINWLLNNNGEVIINWLGYQLLMDALTLFLISVLAVIIAVTIANFVTKILFFQFPSFFKAFSKKRHIKRLEAIIKRQNKAFDIISDLSQFIDDEDLKSAKKLHKKLNSYTKNKKINHHFSNKIKVLQGDSQITKAKNKIKNFSFRNLLR